MSDSPNASKHHRGNPAFDKEDVERYLETKRTVATTSELAEEFDVSGQAIRKKLGNGIGNVESRKVRNRLVWYIPHSKCGNHRPTKTSGEIDLGKGGEMRDSNNTDENEGFLKRFAPKPQTNIERMSAYGPWAGALLLFFGIVMMGLLALTDPATLYDVSPLLVQIPILLVALSGVGGVIAILVSVLAELSAGSSGSNEPNRDTHRQRE